MGQLENMQLFIKLVELGSITKTAEHLGMVKSAVSRRLNELESKLGVKLIQRTTRQSHLTEAGQLYYRKCKLLVSEVDELHDEITCQQQTLTGTLKLAVPLSFGISHLMPALDEFLLQHPDLKLDINFSDRKVDIVDEGFDLAFRIGTLQDSSLRARTITPIRGVFCASPKYLGQYGEPHSLAELKQHKILRYSETSATLTAFDQQEVKHTVQIDSNCIANNGDFLKAMAVSGHGITLIPSFIAWQELRSGELKSVLNDYQLPQMHAYAIFPEARYMPARVRLLIDFLVERFGDNPYWDEGY